MKIGIKCLHVLVITVCATCALLIPFAARAQVDQCKCAENSLDQSTGQRIVQSKFYTVGKNERSNSALLVSVRRIDSLYYLYIVSQLSDCTGTTTKVEFKTTTGESIKMDHVGEVDCGGLYVIYGYAGMTESVIKTLIDDEKVRKGGLTGIRLSNSEHYANIKMSMPFNLRTVFDCVDATFAKEAKSKPKQGLENGRP